MLIVLFLVSHFNSLFVPCGGLSWLPVSFLLHVKYTHYRNIALKCKIFLISNFAKASLYNFYNKFVNLSHNSLDS